MPARKGDGTGLQFNGYQQVRKGDGTVLWSAVDIVDSFEDGDISEYTGDTGNYSAQTGGATSPQDGSYHLNGTSGTSSFMYSESGLENYPSAGDTFQFWIYHGNKDDFTRTFWAVSGDKNTSYSIFLDRRNGGRTVALRKDDNDVIASGPNRANTDSWYRFRIIWGTNGDMTVQMYDSSGNKELEFTGNSSAYTSGGIGFSSNSPSQNSDVYWDGYKIP